MVQDLIRRARRRYISHEALAHLALAASLAIGGIALLLLLGTAYLSWWAILLVVFVGLGVGAWRVRTRIPSDYVMAVRLDSTAGLHDALSTAIHFQDTDPIRQPFRDAQMQYAEHVAGTVNLDTAVPFSTPRALYAMAALGLLATVLFVVRYRTMGTLDLRAPLTQVLFEDQQNPAIAKGVQKNAPKGKKLGMVDTMLAKLGVSMNPEGGKQQPDALDRAVEEAMKAPGTADAGQKGQAPGAKDGAASKDGKAGAPGEQGEKGDPLDGAQDQNGKDGKEAENGKDAKDGKGGDQKDGKSGNGGENSSLLSKVKEAVSNMMSKAKQDTARRQAEGRTAAGFRAAGEVGKVEQR